jgi:hypothetical protein
MGSEQFYLDSVPLEEELLSVKSSDLERRLDYRKQLNFGMVINNAENQSAELINTTRRNLDSTITFTQYNQLIESYLYTLMQTSFLGEIDQSSLSSHYSRKKKLFNTKRIIPSSQYLEELLYGNQLVWGGKYGSIAYYNYITEDKNNYQNPSQILYRSISEIINQTSIINNDSTKVLSYLERFKNLILEDSIAADTELYDLSFDFIRVWDLTSSVELTEFLPQWLIGLIDDYKQGRLNQASENNQINALNSLREIVNLTFRLGLDDANLDTNLTYSFLHQSISPIYFSLVEDIYSIRKRTLFRTSDNRFSYVEEKLKELTDFLKLDNSDGIIREKSYKILTNLFPIGGLNELLLSLSLSLLLRVYIITHVTNNVYRDLEVYPFKASLPGGTELKGRCNKLVYMSGYLLKKCNLNYLNNIGNNLIALSNLYEESELEIERVLDLTR